ncbi:MAG: valine--tRNA ligase [Chthonomonas sp.]|nr:valine--tRNA ligase [Chthonomonas sp.]
MQEVNMPTQNASRQTESKWYACWEEAGLFRPDTDTSKPTYSITIPPPNITGSLHMGHSLCYPTQDVLGRYKRLTGHRVMILPGQDHAGIATQSVVSKQLKAQGVNPTELGREKFIEKVWEWREESGSTILEQFRQLGCAFDWERSRFTLDDEYAKAVLQVFIEWFDAGMIYKGKRVVNWDPVLLTSVSDIETERKNVRGKLYHIRYPFADGSGQVVIATTRPETMLADVAVAVHPSDKRYEGLVGKSLRLPITGREIPLIADQYPDPEFGTGAVKITPAHDPNDFEVGARHNLEMPVVLDERAKVVEGFGDYSGMDRYAARKKIVQQLEDEGFLVKIEDHDIALIVSERSGEVVEPLLSEQWFVRQTELAGPAIEAVKSGKIKITPNRYETVYLDWLENVRDWCISRQLWWGHRIPVFYTADGTAVAAQSWAEAEAKAGQPIERQDNDVLDTWFSSGLWPFATMGWPQETADLAEFYPTSILVTDRNILYLWVARMVMMGCYFCKEIPFHEVLIHATVMTEDGRRMSKSLGTGVDPREIIDKMGADPLRWTLLSQAGSNQEIRYSERRTEDARNFCNKVWNASRFVLMNSEGYEGLEPSSFELVDQWLLSRLAETEAAVRKAYDDYDFQAACQALFSFFWTDYCDWYLEVSKHRLQDPAQRATPQWVLHQALRAFLTMMHPITPFLTEEIMSYLRSPEEKMLMASAWPTIPAAWHQPQIGAQVERWFEITRALRALRNDVGVKPSEQLAEVFVEGDLQGGESVILSQAKVQRLTPGKPSGKSVATTISGVDLHIPIEGLIDPEKERARLQKELEKVEPELLKITTLLSQPNFAERAKPEVVERNQRQQAELEQKIVKIKERMELFGS